ncbi:hypothetical protein FOMPIDRAFT_1026686 [Fomitopsis schrenkii]|uniref:Uncharacterized protein n=1 Tax=Fomitopsis schrenkii TaxID=2126942 RepID=S8ESY6_FOMSC|nr:hypothetical protein FOMPIDRAFT_1026686 [Fomitopsis schrenkii]
MFYRVIIEPKLDKSRRAHEIIDMVQYSYPQHFNPHAIYDDIRVSDQPSLRQCHIRMAVCRYEQRTSR